MTSPKPKEDAMPYEDELRELLSLLRPAVDRRSQQPIMDETKQIVKELASNMTLLSASVQQIAAAQGQLQSEVRDMLKGQNDLIGRLIKMETQAEERSKQMQQQRQDASMVANTSTDVTWKWVGLVSAILLALAAIFKDVLLGKHG